jgi:hypothetical protein
MFALEGTFFNLLCDGIYGLLSKEFLESHWGSICLGIIIFFRETKVAIGIERIFDGRIFDFGWVHDKFPKLRNKHFLVDKNGFIFEKGN